MKYISNKIYKKDVIPAQAGIQFFKKISLIIFIPLIASCASIGMLQDRLAPKQIEGGKVQFRYYSPSAKTVTLAGDFNGWDHDQNQSRTIFMKKNDQDIWEAEVPIQPGRYRYKFVIDYQDWERDPGNPLTLADAGGDLASLLIVK